MIYIFWSHTCVHVKEYESRHCSILPFSDAFWINFFVQFCMKPSFSELDVNQLSICFMKSKYILDPFLHLFSISISSCFVISTRFSYSLKSQLHLIILCPCSRSQLGFNASIEIHHFRSAPAGIGRASPRSVMPAFQNI